MSIFPEPRFNTGLPFPSFNSLKSPPIFMETLLVLSLGLPAEVLPVADLSVKASAFNGTSIIPSPPRSELETSSSADPLLPVVIAIVPASNLVPVFCVKVANCPADESMAKLPISTDPTAKTLPGWLPLVTSKEPPPTSEFPFRFNSAGLATLLM